GEHEGGEPERFCGGDAVGLRTRQPFLAAQQSEQRAGHQPRQGDGEEQLDEREPLHGRPPMRGGGGARKTTRGTLRVTRPSSYVAVITILAPPRTGTTVHWRWYLPSARLPEAGSGTSSSESATEARASAAAASACAAASVRAARIAAAVTPRAQAPTIEIDTTTSTSVKPRLTIAVPSRRSRPRVLLRRCRGGRGTCGWSCAPRRA